MHHSCLKASIGSSFDAFHAGYSPDNALTSMATNNAPNIVVRDIDGVMDLELDGPGLELTGLLEIKTASMPPYMPSNLSDYKVIIITNSGT